VFVIAEHGQFEATWGVYQRMVVAYRQPEKQRGKAMMKGVTDSVTSCVHASLIQIRSLGRTLKQRAADVLAFLDRPGAC